MAIELTGKRYKAMQTIGVVGILAGLIAAIAGGGVIAAVVMGVSLVVFLTGRYGAWWHHG